MHNHGIGENLLYTRILIEDACEPIEPLADYGCLPEVLPNRDLTQRIDILERLEAYGELQDILRRSVLTIDPSKDDRKLHRARQPLYHSLATKTLSSEGRSSISSTRNVPYLGLAPHLSVWAVSGRPTHSYQF
jgi:hypothetical protein